LPLKSPACPPKSDRGGGSNQCVNNPTILGNDNAISGFSAANGDRIEAVWAEAD